MSSGTTKTTPTSTSPALRIHPNSSTSPETAIMATGVESPRNIESARQQQNHSKIQNQQQNYQCQDDSNNNNNNNSHNNDKVPPVMKRTIVPTELTDIGGSEIVVTENVNTTIKQQDEQQEQQENPQKPLTNVKMKSTPQRAPKRHRNKIKEFNDVITCYLCRGYLVNATTIDYCVHTFCRSCIVKHLQEDKHCPQCRPGGKQISLSNLRSDERLKALVYKLVPGLYQNEHQRQMQFYSENVNVNKSGEQQQQDEVALLESEDDYFSPVEPISLSLEYHPKSLEGREITHAPPIRYLQCPAAVTVHHLKRFISSKFDIDLKSRRINIEIIYEDEILPEDFSLMDVGYCYFWKRVAPMKFFYRILIYNPCNKSSQVIPSDDSNVNEIDNTNTEAKTTKKTNESTAQKSVKFKDISLGKEKPKTTTNHSVSSNTAKEISLNKFPTDSESKPSTVVKGKSVKFENLNPIIAFSSNNNNSFNNKHSMNGNNISINNNSNNNNTIETKIKIKTEPIIKLEHDTDSVATDNNTGPVKVTINMKKPLINESKIKELQTDVKMTAKVNKPRIKYTPSIKNDIPMTVINDFKSLRSNDPRFGHFSLNSLSTSKAGKPTNTNTKPNKTVPNFKESPKSIISNSKPSMPSNAMVSIPHQQLHRSSISSSDDSLENMSLAQLKSANKKITTNVDDSIKSTPDASGISENSKLIKKDEIVQKNRTDLPKLKIELASLKTKLTVPKSSPDYQHQEKSPKPRKQSNEDISSDLINQVDLNTYAKNIGLKPINKTEDRKDNNTDNKQQPQTLNPEKSPISTSSSNSSPPSSVVSGFIFHAESGQSSHKKRKKGKHSRDSKDSSGKRRKLHAEISSQPEEESLKLKVKITGNHKSYRSGKKLNGCSNDEAANKTFSKTMTSSSPRTSMTSSGTTIVPAISTLPPMTSVMIESPVNNIINRSSVDNKQNVTNRTNTLVNIPHLNKALSEESANINKLIHKNSSFTKTSESLAQHSNVNKTQSNGQASKTFVPFTSISSTTTPTVSNSQLSNSISMNSPIGILVQKPFPVKLVSAQDTNIPESPPLPPSLFKTTPMSLQTITTTSSKPKLTTQQNDPKNIAMVQLKNLSNPAPVKPVSTHNNFLAPANPSRVTTSIAKPCPITSIASAAHRQAQLKRSASLDSNMHSSAAKQPKIESDRNARKPTYTPFIPKVMLSSLLTNQLQATSMTKANQKNSPSMIAATQANKEKDLRMPEVTSIFTSLTQTFTSDATAKPSLPTLASSSSLNTSGKLSSELITKITYSTPAVTITPQQQPLPPTPYQQQQKQKPALEIVRISSNIPPVDQQPLTITTNNTVKPNPPKTTRPPPPPIPLVKIKRSVNQSTPLKSALSTVSAPAQQAQISNNNKHSPTISTQSSSNKTSPPSSRSTSSVQSSDKKGCNVSTNSKSTAGASSRNEGKVNTSETNCPLDLSGKSSRSPSQEKSPRSSPPAALSPYNSNNTKEVQGSKHQGTTNNLEATVNRLKQNNEPNLLVSNISSTLVTTNIVTSTTALSRVTGINSNAPSGINAKRDATSPNLSSVLGNNTNDSDASSALQNLKLLSESATNREKITIKSQKPLPTLSKLNEINKIRVNPTVRQQNASVRNIPNPSALAFRSTQPMPMLASITKTSTPSQKTAFNSTISSTTVNNILSAFNLPSPNKCILSTNNNSTQKACADSSSTTPLPTTSSSMQNPEVTTSTVTTASTNSVETTKTQNSKPSTLLAVTSGNISNSSSISTLSPTTTSSSTIDTTKLLTSKKNLNIEQVAATLNLRAAAAADNALKANNTTSTVNTTLPILTTTMANSSTNISSSASETNSGTPSPKGTGSNSGSSTNSMLNNISSTETSVSNTTTLNSSGSTASNSLKPSPTGNALEKIPMISTSNTGTSVNSNSSTNSSSSTTNGTTTNSSGEVYSAAAISATPSTASTIAASSA